MSDTTQVVAVQRAPITYHAIQNIPGAEKSVEAFILGHTGRKSRVYEFHADEPLVEIQLSDRKDLPYFEVGRGVPSYSQAEWRDGQDRLVGHVNTGSWIVYSQVDGLEVHTPESYAARFERQVQS